MNDQPVLKINKLDDFSYEIVKDSEMNVPCVLFLNDVLFGKINDGSFNQVRNVACLPGIVGRSIAMPDMHVGYGFSIGGVAAFDLDKGIVTPGGIGFDINCGMRAMKTNLFYDDVKDKISELIDLIFEKNPCGVGVESNIRLSDEDYEGLLVKGAKWAVERGIGTFEDLIFCESNGCLSGADVSCITPTAKKRGRRQLGTVGSGNHFIEIQYVDEVFDETVANVFGLSKGQVVILIHSGSRGFGHQVASDYLRKMEDEYGDVISKLPEKDLIYAPLNSKLGKDYFKAMACAANYGWCNRHIMGHNVREVFELVFKDAKFDVKVDVLYDIGHNIAKIEEHVVDGVKKKVCVHRKGAARCFPANHPDVPEKYKSVGHPVIIPGSMGTSSYILVGLEKSMQVSFGSCCHGAGRVMGRKKAKETIDSRNVLNDLRSQNIYFKGKSRNGVVEEAPSVYKDVDEVIRVIQGSGIAKPVVKLKPMGVVKG